uniref:Uncharacterized protein n=1 Tax=Mustela putorius furo TaxID=9669 RepID=M3Y115_MUSPF
MELREFYFPVLTLRVQGGRLLAPGDPPNPEGSQRAPPCPTRSNSWTGPAPRSRGMRKGRGNSPCRAGEEGGPRACSSTQRGDAAADPTGHRRQLKARLCSPALARLRGPQSALLSVLSENTSRIPPVPSWIQPRLPVRFPVHLSRQEVPAAATVAPQPSHRRRRTSSRAGQPGFWCLAAN